MSWFIAVRYCLSHKRQTLVCILGVMISVTMFISMTALMGGFTDKFIVETVESSGHIIMHDEPREASTPILEHVYTNPNTLIAISSVKPRTTVQRIKNPTGLMMQLRRIPGIVDVAPQVFGNAIATYGTRTLSLDIFGIEPERQTAVTTIGKDIIAGDFTRLRTAADGIVIGRGVADVLGAHLDDEVSIASSTGGRTTARVVGIFQTGVTPVDYARAYMLINSAQTLLDKKNVVNEIVIRTTDYNAARELAAQIESVCGYKTESWQEANANFLKIFAIQTLITYIIIAALLVVAAFGVLNILIMAVLERVNDIAVLKSFGLSRGDITRIYMIQGLVIGLIGAGVGVALGKATIEGLRRVPIEMEGLVRSEGLLMSEHPSQYVVAFFSALAVTVLASIYPARRAARYDPVEVIRGAH